MNTKTAGGWKTAPAPGNSACGLHHHTQTMCLHQQANLHLEQAEVLVLVVIEPLLPACLKSAGPELSRAIEDLAAQLKIRLLFPQLAGWQCQWLLALYWQRRALTQLVNAPQRDIPPRLRPQAEAATRKIEQHYMALAAQIRNLAAGMAMTPVQQALLDRE